MLKTLLEKRESMFVTEEIHHDEGSVFTLGEIDWMLAKLKQQEEEIKHLRKLRTTIDYEERRESERALLRIAQQKDFDRK